MKLEEEFYFAIVLDRAFMVWYCPYLTSKLHPDIVYLKCLVWIVERILCLPPRVQ